VAKKNPSFLFLGFTGSAFIVFLFFYFNAKKLAAATLRKGSKPF
jgi:hypothetical protein